jgi:hypothetical protein
MKRQSLISKKRRGPPLTGKGTPILVRLQPPQLKALDKWNAHYLTRPEAIRHLLEFALTPHSVDLQDQPAAVDGWIVSQGGNLTRQEAICRLVEIGLKAKM